MRDNRGSLCFKVGITGQVIAVVKGEDGSIHNIVEGKNLITDGGDTYYAQLGATVAVSNDFEAGGLRLGSDNTAPAKADTDVTTFIASTGKAETSGYPKVNCTDANNSGGGATDIVTWKFDYAVGDFSAASIAEGAIVDNTTTPTAALCHFLFAAAFSKSTSETLVIFINHTFLGA